MKHVAELMTEARMQNPKSTHLHSRVSFHFDSINLTSLGKPNLDDLVCCRIARCLRDSHIAQQVLVCASA